MRSVDAEDLELGELTDNDVSVVVQGPVGPRLSDVLASVRRVLPAAQLIVSTWQGSDVVGLDADDVILNEDPGSVPLIDEDGAATPRMMNVNRMLVSSRNGVERCERSWSIKLRSDSPIESPAFVDWIGRYPTRVDELDVFDQRILTSTIATRPGRAAPGYLFHPSDCVHIGTTSDLRRLWATPTIDETESAGWLVGKPRPAAFRWGSPRYFNEQVLWLGCLAAAGHDVGYQQAGDVSPELIRRSDLSIVNNFVVLEPWQLGIRMPTLEPQVSQLELPMYMWHTKWQELYGEHIDG
ncbi:MAG: WavE lipopolysaccharide synthesis family protein [Acidimicrobiia bacterium]